MDRQAPLWLLQTLPQKTGIPIKAVSRLSLTVYADRLFERRLLSGKQQWLLPLHIYHRIRRGFGTQFCPLCLREDRVPYFRKIWRLALHTFCSKHNAMLHDRCPSCQIAVAFHRQNPMPTSTAEFKSLAICTTCGFDLATSTNMPVSIWDEEIHRYRVHAFAKIEGSRCGKDKWGFSLFPVLHHLCKILAGMGRARKNHLFEYVQQQTSAPATLLTLETRALENRPSAERHALLNAAHWLLTRWPQRLHRAWENGAVNYSQLLRDGHNLPKWYREGVFAFGGRLHKNNVSPQKNYFFVGNPRNKWSTCTARPVQS
jgi:hypothetical protein